MLLFLAHPQSPRVPFPEREEVHEFFVGRFVVGTPAPPQFAWRPLGQLSSGVIVRDAFILTALSESDSGTFVERRFTSRRLREFGRRSYPHPRRPHYRQSCQTASSYLLRELSAAATVQRWKGLLRDEPAAVTMRGEPFRPGCRRNLRCYHSLF